VHLEGEEREVTCFFSDLAGFTAISETLDSQSTVRLLNQYMYEMNAELTQHEAYVNKFLGDGIMAIWGAFKLGTPHAERACRAALGCRTRLAELNRRQDQEELPRLSMRIGIATGVVTLGDCGAPPDLRDYTVIGDSANLAARLESANKQFGTRILINGRTKEFLPDEILTRPLGVATVVGQKTPTEIHEVVALAGEASEEQRERIDLTTRAVAAYREAQFDEAVDLWRQLRRDPDSALLAELYLAQIALYHGGTDLDFDGVLHLTKK
jgi:adenylate cyclase